MPSSAAKGSISNSERLYRTGDIARYRPDGRIEWLARIDQQIKLRGHRIELGEIEAILRQHPSVAQCVVLVSEDTPGDQRLVAYVVPAQEPGTKHQEPGDPTDGSRLALQVPVPGSAELRAFLQERLPNYMLPAAFVTLEALPLTPNGKIDRRRLPAPEAARPALPVAYTPPDTELEQAIAAVWRAVLQVDNVGVHDSFFDLGGHSLLLVQVQSKLRDVLDREIAIVDLFQYPTVSDLAGYLSRPRPPDAPTESQSRAEKQRVLTRRQRTLRDRRQSDQG